MTFWNKVSYMVKILTFYIILKTTINNKVRAIKQIFVFDPANLTIFEMNYDSNGVYDSEKEIKFKTVMLRSSLCGYSDV